eukprot:12887657-Prorocentrum_lima.AAC.1
MISGTSTTAIFERAQRSASAVLSCWSMHLSVGTAIPRRPGEVKSSALRTALRRRSVSSVRCASVSSILEGGVGVE